MAPVRCDISRVIAKLQQYKPKVIGLDLYRDIPKPPGNQQLLEQLQAPNIITITKLDDGDDGGVPPPPGVPKERVGFNDFVLDPDNAIRRNLMFASTGYEEFYSFSLRLSLSYLAKQDIKLKILPNALELGKTVFVALESNSGGYEKIDAQGYQVLLNYRSAKNVAQQATVTQVLNGQLNPEWVRDRVVLIGTTAPSAKDLFITPYSAANPEQPNMPGVLVHAQMVSQILSAVLDRRSLFWFWSQWSEAVWVWCWSLVGGILALRLRYPLSASMAITASVCLLCSITYLSFMQAVWVPLVAPALALVATNAIIAAYKQTALQIANQQLQRLVCLDGLTQIANRRGFDEYLSVEWLRMAQTQQPLSLIMCDVDYFKRYNDTYGHPAGDVCLKQVAGAISRAIKRSADFAARYGGEEFAIVLPSTNALGAVCVAEAIQQEVQQLMIPHAASSVCEYVTLRMGVSSKIPSQNLSFEGLIAAADKALYQAKEQGRNRIVVETLDEGIGL